MELQIRGVSKTYPNGVHVLKDVTLTIPAGMYGLLGPNGAGKSTLMRILATLQEPDGGSVQLGDIDVLNQKDEVRKTLGYLPQEFGVYPKVSADVVFQIKCRNFSYLLLKSISSTSKLQQWQVWRTEICATKIREFGRRSEKAAASAKDLTHGNEVNLCAIDHKLIPVLGWKWVVRTSLKSRITLQHNYNFNEGRPNAKHN